MVHPTQIGPYPVISVLNDTGGMGVLYLAQDPELPRKVAVKVMREALVNSDFRERFVREAHNLSQLHHPNIVTILRFQGGTEGPCYLAMEYIVGESLRSVIAHGRPLGLRRTLEILDQLCSAIAHAHRRVIVHRDIKPENVMLERESGLVKVIDFGIARTLNDSLVTSSGTPYYMAPEQAAGRGVDARSDIYSIGLVAFELLCVGARSASHRVGGGNSTEWSSGVPLDALEPAARSLVGPIIEKATQLRPSFRYPTVEALHHDIRAALERLRAPAPRRSIPVAAVVAAVLVGALGYRAVTQSPGDSTGPAPDRRQLQGVPPPAAAPTSLPRVEQRSTTPTRPSVPRTSTTGSPSPAAAAFAVNPAPVRNGPTGKLTVQGLPGTSVSVDGRPVGLVQGDGQLLVPDLVPGRHDVSTRSPNSAVSVNSVQVTAGREVVLDATPRSGDVPQAVLPTGPN